MIPRSFFAETQQVNLTMMATLQDVQTAVKMFHIAVLVSQAFMYRTACIACEPLLVSISEVVKPEVQSSAGSHKPAVTSCTKACSEWCWLSLALQALLLIMLVLLNAEAQENHKKI